MTHEEILSNLPYSEPFLFVEKLLAIDENGAKGSFTFREDLDFFRGHFKYHPVVPGVIITETMAQIGVACLGIYLMKGESSKASIAMTSVNIEFLKKVGPDETIVVTSVKKYFRFGKLKCYVTAQNESGELVASGEISGMIIK